MTELDTAATSPDDLVRRVRDLDERLEAVGDPLAREAADELVGTVMDLYGAGLERIFSALADGDSSALTVRDRLANDPVVAGLLLIHDLHPVGLEDRVAAALESVRPYLQSHSGDVELLGFEGGVVRLRLKGSCDGCPSSASTLELAIEQALEEAAPDLTGIEVEGVVSAQPVFHGRQLPLASAPASSPGWTALEGVGGLAPDTMNAVLVDGVNLVVANVGGTFLAYRNECAGCGGSLDRGELEYGILTCQGCSRSFQLPLAGRLLGGEESLQLIPVPLLAENGGNRVAVAA
jgi:Fe-S cluster biogenesis protein NfuA/nitrite reductase/ring-hydroxylating ferredoxin subunit